MLRNKIAISLVGLVAILGCLALLTSCDKSRPDSTIIPDQYDLSGLIYSNPAEVDNTGLPITPVDRLHVTGDPTEVDIAAYHLTVDGLVNTPLSLSYGELTRYPAISKVVLLICPGAFADNAQWTGVTVETLLTEASVEPQATQVTFYSLDGYQETLPLSRVEQGGVFLAYKVDGQTLPLEHGYPLRLVVSGDYGSRWVKWLGHIQIS